MKLARPIPLSKDAFAPFGDVVEVEGAARIPINQGFAERFNDLARVDVASEGGAVNISIVTASPRPQPIAITLMERHPLGSQIFFPLQDRPWLVLVCGDPLDAGSYRAFVATGRQGVNYARNIWHHPLLVFDAGSRFMVADRKGPGFNLEEMLLPAGKKLSLTA
ncbi:MAG: ureidoglycolate lyase [Rhizobiales bacterium]|nr:ureidoglycolate lyase [Hyphomicrobiales bacterium]MBI3674207.1 ureidoglycolate lyase [Hyphomicrobiales bacterium]